MEKSKFKIKSRGNICFALVSIFHFTNRLLYVRTQIFRWKYIYLMFKAKTVVLYSEFYTRFCYNHIPMAVSEGAVKAIKQFVVTNCSKERPSSIVNETLKSGILMLKDTSKESNLYADSKYISFVKFSLCHQKLRAWENLPYFGKQGKKTPKILRILTKTTPSHSAYQRTL